MVNSGIAIVYAPFPVVPLREVKWLISQHRMGLYNKARPPHVNSSEAQFPRKRGSGTTPASGFIEELNPVCKLKRQVLAEVMTELMVHGSGINFQRR